MQGIKIGIIFAGLLAVCWAGQKIGDSCKRIGICAPYGSCPDRKLGRCCGGLDCCEPEGVCYGEGAYCNDGQGMCVPDCYDGGQVLEGGDCCGDLKCCSQKCLGDTETCPFAGDKFQCRASPCENGGHIPFYGGCCFEAGGSGNPKYCCETPPKP